jgi:prepilin-type N-terminal cleavage/methylation domain-containing protein
VRAKDQRGFTITEVIVAVVVLAVGLLGLAMTAGQVTRMIGRGQRSAAATTYAFRRLELLRPLACAASRRADGTETLARSGTLVATNTWTFTDDGSESVRIRLVSSYLTVQGRTRTDTLETAVSCRV